jgi:uncharacterized membrane-anchored protein YhcB (DUF1043 family)
LSSPVGTNAGALAVLLAICGFLFIPAIVGAVAGIVLGAVLSRYKSDVDDYTDEALERFRLNLQTVKAEMNNPTDQIR